MSALELADPLQRPIHRFGLSTIVLSTCAINLLSLALPIATLQIYDRVLQSGNVSTLHVLLFGVVVALAFETVLRIVRSFLVCRRGAAYAHVVSCAALNRQLDTRVASGEQHALASELAALSAVKSIKDFRSGYSTIVLVDLLFLPLFIGIIAHISNMLVLVPVALLCGFGLLIAVNGLKIRSHMEASSANDDLRNDFIIDTLTSSQFVKSHALEKLLQRRFEKLHTASCASSYWLSRSITESVVFGATLGHLITAATVAVGAFLAAQDLLTVGALIAVVQMSNRLLQPVQQGILLWIRFHGYETAKAKVERLFNKPTPPVMETLPDIPNDGRLKVEHVNFRPDRSMPLLFDNVNLSLEHGQTAILDGPTGSGKTVLLKMIAGIYAPSSGSIRINGFDASQIPSFELARHVGYLAPRSILLRGTIRANITRFGQVPLGQAMEIARYIGLQAEFERLPMGIDTSVGVENDSNLSPGLIQMVSLLRVLASKPRIILFDDADNGVDTDYYNRLFSLLGKIKPNVAMVIVSRDLNIRQLADRRWLLSDGRLIETEVPRVRPTLKLAVA